MKKYFSAAILVFLTILSLFIFSPEVKKVKASEYKGWDLIREYHINVTPNDDGTLFMEYHIQWEVLKSPKGDGVDWIKVGVPNRFVSNFSFDSECPIEKMSYYTDLGSYIRLDLKKMYYQGEIFDVNFSFTQSRIFTYDKDLDQVQFSFIPGWFPDSKTLDMEVTWNAKGYEYIPDDEGAPSSIEGEIIKWHRTDLDYGETIECNISYSKSFFPNIDLSKDYSSEYYNKSKWMIIFVGIAIVAIGLIFGIWYYSRHIYSGGYYAYRGYYGPQFYLYISSGKRYRYHPGVKGNGKPIIVNSSSGGRPNHGGGRSCACACACACAGGGRAGCSRKDFIVSEANDFAYKLSKVETSKE